MGKANGLKDSGKDWERFKMTINQYFGAALQSLNRAF